MGDWYGTASTVVELLAVTQTSGSQLLIGGDCSLGHVLPGSACKQHLRGSRGWMTGNYDTDIANSPCVCAEPIATTETVTAEAVTTTTTNNRENNKQ